MPLPNTVEEAWTAAYFFLAQVFIDREGALYLERKQALGGWRDGRTFVVREKQVESAYVTSFVLVPADGGAVLDYQPGQYIGIEVTPEEVIIEKFVNTPCRMHRMVVSIAFRLSAKGWAVIIQGWFLTICTTTSKLGIALNSMLPPEIFSMLSVSGLWF